MKHADLFNIYKAMQDKTPEDRDRGFCQGLQNYMASYFKTDEEALESQIENGTISFSQLPYLFRPGEKVVVRPVNNEMHHGSTLRSCAMGVKNGVTVFSILYSPFSYDGKHLGRATLVISLDHFVGSRQIHDLPVAPLKYHPEHQELRDKLVAQGETYISIMRKQPCMYHDGIVFSTFKKLNGFEHKGPVLVGLANFHDRMLAHVPIPFEQRKDLASDTLSSEDLFDCVPYVPAYTLGEGRQGKCYVSIPIIKH